MSARAKKNLTIYSVLFCVAIIGLFLYFSTRELSSQNMEISVTPMIGNIESSDGEVRLISRTKSEDVTKRNPWKREFVVEKEIEYVDPDTGEIVQDTVSSRIVEVGSGLNYKKDGEWVPSNPHFVKTPYGFDLVECAYEASFGRTLSDGMTYEVDGVPIPMAIEYSVVSDGRSEKTFSIPPNIVGEIDLKDPSVLHFRNPLGNIDVTYRAGKGGFHQDVKIKSVDTLKTLAVVEKNTKVYVYTKIDESRFVSDNVDVKIGDDTFRTTDFTFTMTEPVRDKQILFTKLDDDKRVPLFVFDRSVVFDSDGKEADVAEKQLWRNPTSQNLYLVESVALASLADGSVIDYHTQNEHIVTDTVWTANQTYYVSTDVNVSADDLTPLNWTT